MVLHVARACPNVAAMGPHDGPNGRSCGLGATMILAIADLLSAPDLEAIGARLAAASFREGSATAGWSARLVKNNLQASEGPELQSARDLIEARLLEHTVL